MDPATSTAGVPVVTLNVVGVRLLESIASLKVALAFALSATPVVPSRGALDKMVGTVVFSPASGPPGAPAGSPGRR